MELTYAKDDSNRLFAASQYGAIWTFENRSDVTDSHLFLDLRGKVYDWKKPGANEQGLLGLAMHPDFKTNGYFYVYYSHPDGEEVGRIAVYDFQSMIRIAPIRIRNGVDGNRPAVLRITMAVRSSLDPTAICTLASVTVVIVTIRNANGQDLSTVLGSILRIDVDHPAEGLNYGIPADNPFVDVEGARPEIYAYGVRNPWRIAFDPRNRRPVVRRCRTRTLGRDQPRHQRWQLWMEQSRRDAPVRQSSAVEGVSEPIDPVWEYDHQIGKSITGGRVYRSSRLPELTGKYLYADYVTGSVWALTYDPATGKATRNEQVIPDSIAVLAFGEDQSGEVYYLTDSTRGECIYRFEAK